MVEKEGRVAEQLKERDDVSRELRRTGGMPQPSKPVERKHKVWIGSYVLLVLALAVVYYLLRLRQFGLPEQYVSPLQRATLGAMAIVLVLSASTLINTFLLDPLEDAVARYNLRRVLRLLTVLVIAFIIISILFANWYTAAVSLGILSLILGFALQTPITSFIGWIYILTREPYRVGDRIRIGEAAGDVIDVGYLDTTLWEFGGEYLSTDHPSGRLIKFPNSNVLDTPVYNYSWPLFPYIWNEITFHVAYDSDLDFIAQTMREVTESELGPEMTERVNVFCELLEQTQVDQLQIREHPAIIFRVNPNTWLEATVRYLVAPKEAGRVKTKLIRTMLERLNSEPTRVLFPKSNMR